MNGKTFTILCGVTVVAVVGAGFAVVAQRATQTIPEPTATAILPEVAAHPDTIARIQLKTPSFALDLQKKGDGWIDASRGGYPVRTPVVSSLITSLGALRPLDAKTTNPTLYSRLGVEDYKPGATSTLVDLADAGGASLGDLIVGNRSSALSFDPLGGTFVRPVDDKQTWLVQGAAALPPDFSDWFEEIPNYPGTDVQRVTIVENGKTVFDAKKDGITYHMVPPPAPAPVPAAPATAPAPAAGAPGGPEQTAAAGQTPAPATTPPADTPAAAPTAAAATTPTPAAASPAPEQTAAAGQTPAAATTPPADTPAATTAAAPAPAATPAAPAPPPPQANDSTVKRMAQAIVSGTFDDVAPVTKVDFSKGRIVRFALTGGLTIETQLGTLDGKEEWITLTPKASEGATADQAKQADTLAAKTKGWAYKLPDYRVGALQVTLAELTAPPPDVNQTPAMMGMPGQGPGPGAPMNVQDLPPELLKKLPPDVLRQLQGGRGAPAAGQ